MPDILNIEQHIASMEQDTLHTVEHYQIDGVYVRALKMKAGTVLTGKIHKKEHISILAHGEIAVADANDVKRIKAPYIMIDKPGIKRLGYCLSDVTFINVLRTDKTEIPDIEQEAVCDTFEEYDQHLKLLEAE